MCDARHCLCLCRVHCVCVAGIRQFDTREHSQCGILSSKQQMVQRRRNVASLARSMLSVAKCIITSIEDEHGKCRLESRSHRSLPAFVWTHARCVCSINKVYKKLPITCLLRTIGRSRCTKVAMLFANNRRKRNGFARSECFASIWCQYLTATVWSWATRALTNYNYWQRCGPDVWLIWRNWLGRLMGGGGGDASEYRDVGFIGERVWICVSGKMHMFVLFTISRLLVS